MNCQTCGIPVLQHEANRCLDAWVAERVLGHHFYQTSTGELWSTDLPGYYFLAHYSTDIAAAWMVFEKFKGHGWDLGWHIFTSGPLGRGERREGWFVTDGGEYDFHEIAFGGDSPCLAICRAALLAVLDS